MSDFECSIIIKMHPEPLTLSMLKEQFGINARYAGKWKALWYTLWGWLVVPMPPPLAVLDNFGIPAKAIRERMRA